MAADDAPTMAERPARPRRPSTEAFERGAVIGRYVVLDQLGAGGMGVVYAAWDPDLNRRVALKLVHAGPGGSSGGPSRILREAQALARLSHPNVVSIYDVGTFGNRVFLAMELVEGQTLEDWMTSGKRTWREVLSVFAAAGSGLAAAHAAGVIHRDFKPGNVILGKDGRVRVVDFGLARAAGHPEPIEEPPSSRDSHDALGTELTIAGAVLGTPVYMPPEAYRGEVVGESGDQFSFCVALHEALYGERPFDHMFADTLPPVVPAPEHTDVPPWVRRIVLRGLAAAIPERFPSMNALLCALAADPAVKRRKWLAALSAAAIAAGVVFAAVELQGAQHTAIEDPCAMASPMTGTWDPLVKARVHAAFKASHAPNADADFARAAAALDEASASWLSERDRACADTRQRHAEPEAVLLLRLACLDREKEDLAALVAVLGRADAKLVSSAAQAVGQLAGPALCANARSLSYVEPPPEPLQGRATELRLRLSEGRALLLTGQEREAGDRLRSLVADARKLGYQPLLAEALYLLARHDLDDFASAIRHLDEAEAVALASHDDAIAARAAALRLTEGAVAGKEDALLENWSARARAWVARDGDLEAEFDVEQSLGILAENKGDHADAEAHLERAIEVGRRAFGEASTRVFGAEASLALALIQLARYDDAVAMLGPAIERFEHAYGPGSVRLRDALDNYALALAQIGRTQEARAALERALAMGNEEDVARGALLCDLSRVALAEGDTARAVELGERGVKLIKSLRVEKINLAINEDPLAAAYLAAGRYSEALDLSNECLAEFAKAGNEGIDTVPCRAIQGEALVDVGRAVDATAVLGRALSLQTGHPAAPGALANVRFQLARALIDTGGDRARAGQLAAQASEELMRYGFERKQLERVEAWRKAQLP